MSTRKDQNTVNMLVSAGLERRRQFLRTESVGGHCYLLLFLYFFQLSNVSFDEFKSMVQLAKSLCGANPSCSNAYTSVFTAFVQYLISISNEWKEDSTTKGQELYEETKESKIRLRIREIDESFHLEEGESLSCECEGPICLHGYDFRMMSSVMMVNPDKRIGSSSFDAQAFLNSGLPEEDISFEDAFSQLTVDKNELLTRAQEFVERSDKRNGTSISRTISEKPINRANIPPPPPLPNLTPKVVRKPWIRAPSLEHERHVTQHVQPPFERPLSPPDEPPNFQFKEAFHNPDKAYSEVSTVSPNDSSTVIGRYNRKFMRNGTVLTVLSERPAQTAGTSLTVQNLLVEGYFMTPEMQQIETEAVTELTPINGLVQPFKNNRLNFLMNLNTGLIRCMKYDDTDFVRCVFHSMRTKPVSPADNLLSQVLKVSIDKHMMVYKSNPFQLPYIRVGMQVNKISVRKILDLTSIELQTLWHSEMCDLIVPEHHDMYLATPKQNHRTNHPIQQKSTRTKSILGF